MLFRSPEKRGALHKFLPEAVGQNQPAKPYPAASGPSPAATSGGSPPNPAPVALKAGDVKNMSMPDYLTHRVNLQKMFPNSMIPANGVSK